MISELETPHVELKIYPPGWDKPLQVIAVLDTSAAASILYPDIIPNDHWDPHFRTFFAISKGGVLTTKMITSQPFMIELFPRIYFPVPRLFQIDDEDQVKKIEKHLIEESCVESHKEFLRKTKHPLWINQEFFIRFPFKKSENIKRTKGRKGRLAMVHLYLLHTRFNKYQHVNLSSSKIILDDNGTVFITMFPNFNILLADPQLMKALTIQASVWGGDGEGIVTYRSSIYQSTLCFFLRHFNPSKILFIDLVKYLFLLDETLHSKDRFLIRLDLLTTGISQRLYERPLVSRSISLTMMDIPPQVSIYVTGCRERHPKYLKFSSRNNLSSVDLIATINIPWESALDEARGGEVPYTSSIHKSTSCFCLRSEGSRYLLSRFREQSVSLEDSILDVFSMLD
ncbi:hypothetical protein CQW23_23960 [Capsicum baccatum]|uniref:Uncharacterized protein n=1 Tax=Capsicum baccatum TaxID=33114 RepID=A0A2G2VTE5_CAPBA|nr:hypothetical protein CQW23_23960 [Capsicum baccatum]